MEQRSIYLDAQGTERPRPEAIAAIHFHLTEAFGNPSAVAHESGRRALFHLEQARETVADVLGASVDGVVFCSGATEANNLVLASLTEPGGVLIVSAIEHKSVLSPAHRLAGMGVHVEVCPVDSDGLLDMEQLRARLGRRKTVVSIMHANNEIGTIQPIADIAALCRKSGALLHVDAAQSVGKVRVNVGALGADAITVSGHKFGGPIGSGALVLGERAMGRIVPQILGGDQEAGLRGGTTPVALAAGLAAALQAANLDRPIMQAKLQRLRDGLIAGISDLPGYFMNGHPHQRLASNFSGGFLGVDARLLLRQIPEIHIATGSACTTGQASSHVLEALRLPPDRRQATVRISLGWSNTDDDIDHVIRRLRAVIPQLQRQVA